SLRLCGSTAGETFYRRAAENAEMAQRNSCALTRVITYDELLTRSFIRHFRLVLPCMAHLSGAGRGVYWSHPVAAVAISARGCFSNCSVPKPDSTVCFRNVARLLWLRIETMSSDSK